MKRQTLHKLEIFNIYNLTETWVAENINNTINKHYRKWLQLPISSNITHLTLPKTKLGLNIKTAKQSCIECKLSARRILESSKEANKLYELTSYRKN